MSVRDAYNTWAASYDSDRNLTRDLDQQVTRATLGGLQPSAILELGCGTGKNTAFLAELGVPVHALDFSEGMLQQARAKVPQAHVTFTVADLAARWPCADQAVDLVVCNLVLEHIANLAHIFAEADRCLRSPGHFFISELHPFKQYLGSKAVFQQDQEAVTIPAFVHHISEFCAGAAAMGFTLSRLQEWWHSEDEQTLPRLVSFLFEK